MNSEITFRSADPWRVVRAGAFVVVADRFENPIAQVFGPVNPLSVKQTAAERDLPTAELNAALIAEAPRMHRLLLDASEALFAALNSDSSDLNDKEYLTQAAGVQGEIEEFLGRIRLFQARHASAQERFARNAENVSNAR